MTSTVLKLCTRSVKDVEVRKHCNASSQNCSISSHMAVVAEHLPKAELYFRLLLVEFSIPGKTTLAASAGMPIPLPTPVNERFRLVAAIYIHLENIRRKLVEVGKGWLST